MAAVTNSQALTFCNAQARVMADMMYASYATAKSFLAAWNAQSLSAVIPNDTSPISDGAAADGRPLVTGAMITNVVTRAQEIITDYEAASNAKLNTVAAVKVLGKAAF